MNRKFQLTMEKVTTFTPFSVSSSFVVALCCPPSAPLLLPPPFMCYPPFLEACLCFPIQLCLLLLHTSGKCMELSLREREILSLLRERRKRSFGFGFFLIYSMVFEWGNDVSTLLGQLRNSIEKSLLMDCSKGLLFYAGFYGMHAMNED